MKKIFLILYLLTQINFAQSDLLLLFGGARVYSANLVTTALDGTMEISTPTYTSNFASTADSWSGVRSTAAGNVDGIGGVDDVLSAWADNVNNTHFVSRSGLYTSGKAYAMTLSYYIPSANTNVKRMSIGNYSGTLSPTGGTEIYTTNDAWTAAKLLFLSDGSVVRLQQGSAASFAFVGANSNSDDLTYYKSISLSEIPKWNRGSGNPNHSIDTSTTYANTGSYSLKLVSTGAGSSATHWIQLNAANYTTLVSGTKYELKFYVRSATATTTITYLIGDKTGTSANISTTGFDELIFEFTATASTVNQPLKLYLSKAATVYIDDLTLRSYAE